MLHVNAIPSQTNSAPPMPVEVAPGLAQSPVLSALAALEFHEIQQMAVIPKPKHPVPCCKRCISCCLACS